MEVVEKRCAARYPFGVSVVAVRRNFRVGGWREAFGGPMQYLRRLHGQLLRLVRTKIGDDRMSLLQPAHEYCDLCLGQRPVLGSSELPGGIFAFDRASKLGLLLGAQLGFMLPVTLLVICHPHRYPPRLPQTTKIYYSLFFLH